MTDQDAAIGFSVTDVLEYAGGTHEISVRWLPSMVVYGPESGDGKFTLELTRAGGPAVSVTGVGSPQDTCEAHVNVPVDLRVKSAGGALDEHLSGVLVVTSNEVATLRIDIPLDAVRGSLAVSPPASDALTRLLVLYVTFSRYGFEGHLEQQTLGAGSGGPSFAASERLAQFPAERPCEHRGLEVAVGTDLGHGITSEDLMVTVADATEQLQLRRGGGQASDLRFDLVRRHTCVNQTMGLHVLLLVTAELVSADGKLNVHFEDLGMTPTVDDAGEVRSLRVTQPSGVQSRTVEAIQNAIPEVDLSGVDQAWIELAADFDNQGVDWAATGRLEVLGGTPPECLTNPVPGEACTPDEPSSIFEVQIAK